MHLEIKKDKDYIFQLSITEYNLDVIPTTCTIIINNNSGTAVSSGSATIATDGTLSYTFPAADNDTQANNFSIEWAVVSSGVTTYYNNLFDVVLMPINNLVNDEDLFIHCKELRDKTELVYNTSAEGTITTLISDRFNTNDILWQGGEVVIYIDDSTTHDAKITAYDSDTDTITFTPAYSVAIASGLRFKIRSSFQRYIDEAFNNFVYRDIRNKLPLASGYLDDNVLRNLTIFKALSIYAGGEYNEEGDKWWLRYQDYMSKYNTEFESLKSPYDNNQDGSVSDEEDINRPSFTTSNMVR